MALVPSSFQPGLPANGTLWRTVALILALAALASALIGVMSNLFEQVDRRSEEARRAARQKRRGQAGASEAGRAHRLALLIRIEECGPRSAQD